MGIRKLNPASSISVKRRGMNKKAKRNAMIHMTTEIFGNDLIKGALSESKDVKQILQTIDNRYAEFVEARVQEIIERKYLLKFESKEQCAEWINENCTLLRSEEENPINILYFSYQTENEFEIANWRDSPDAMNHLTRPTDHSIEEE